jgi:hypothetical protein
MAIFGCYFGSYQGVWVGEMSVGLQIMRPTSVVVTGAGSSASIQTDGGVAFFNATSLSLNGVFSGDYDNYKGTIRSVLSSGNATIDARLRTFGTDATTNYTYQYLIASSTSVTGVRSTTYGYAVVGNTSATQRSGDQFFVYGPNLVQATAFRNISARGSDNATIADWACTHSTAASYDGITLFCGAGATFTGMVTMYGYAQ